MNHKTYYLCLKVISSKFSELIITSLWDYTVSDDSYGSEREDETDCVDESLSLSYSKSEPSLLF